jgi:IS30 family transposase
LPAEKHVIEQRLRLGDFEGDTVLGPPGTGGLATLVDRKSRFTIITKVQSKQADHVHERIKQRPRELEEERRRSITFDNGTEFARCHRLEKHLGIELYFADPGCPYQRGTNENTNGLIRQYFPKGTDFRNVSHHEVREVENRMNHRPRACLGFRTPHEVFFGKSPPSSCN